MFTLGNLQHLLNARPFVPFRLVMSDGGSADVISPEVAIPGKRFAIVGIMDPKTNYKVMSWWTTVWYTHVTRVEHMHPGAPPFAPPPENAPSSTPSPAS